MIFLKKNKMEGLNEYINCTPPLINILLWENCDVNIFNSIDKEELDNLFDLLSLFKNAKTNNKNLILYRGINSDIKLEKIFFNKGLISTSPNKEYASNYSTNGQIIEINVPIGTKILDVYDYNIDNNDEGQEIILLPGRLCHDSLNKYNYSEQQSYNVTKNKLIKIIQSFNPKFKI